MRKMIVIIGGPAYQMSLDARHCGSMVELTVALLTSGRVSSLRVLYEHGCPVEMARNAIMRDALSSDGNILISADADVSWDSSAELVWGAQWIWGYGPSGDYQEGQPLLAIPVHQRNGDSNIIASSDFKRVRGKFETGRTPRQCWAAGTGLMIFNLDWYRKNWPDGPWFRSDWVDVGRGLEFVSEDIWHTSRLRRHGGEPLWAPLTRTWHCARGTTEDTSK